MGWRKLPILEVCNIARMVTLSPVCDQGFSVVDVLVRAMLYSRDFPEQFEVPISSPIPPMGAGGNAPPPAAATKSGSNFAKCPLLWVEEKAKFLHI